MRDLRWSPAEKIVARKVFDQALQLELKEIVEQIQDIAAKVEGARDLWDLERWLTKRRSAIERKYDYRYSMLPFVFATLLNEGRVSRDDLRGLGQEKFELIQRIASPDYE